MVLLGWQLALKKLDGPELVQRMFKDVSKRGVDGVPFRLVLLEDLALGVVADDLDVDEAAQVELFGAELCH